jgi:hypothetical protein
MRRLLITGVVAAATFAALVLPSSAFFDSHFAVISDTVESHRTDDGFRFREQLFQIENPSNQVGRDQGRCSARAHRKFKCKVVVHLNGEVGGLGFLRVNGNIGPGDNRLNVTGGTGDFAGVAGKVVLSGPRGTVISVSLVD